MKRICMGAGMCALVAVLSTVVTRRIYGQNAWKAITYQQTETWFRAPNTIDRVQKTLHAVRGDGSTVELRKLTAPDGSNAESCIIFDLSTQVRVTVVG